MWHIKWAFIFGAFILAQGSKSFRQPKFQHILVLINTQAKALLSGASLHIGRDKPEARLSVFGFAEWEGALCSLPSWQIPYDRAAVWHPPLAFKQNLVWKGQLTLGSTWGMRWKTQHHKGCFCRTVVNQNLTQWLHWTERFMWITSLYSRLPQDDKYGLSQALLSNLSEIAPEHFDQHVTRRDVCGKCLQEKKTPASGLCWSLYPVIHAVNTKKMPQVLWQKPHTVVLNIVVVSTATP